MTKTNSDQDFDDLLARLCEEQLSDQDWQRLVAILGQSDVHRQRYLDYIELHACLWSGGGTAAQHRELGRLLSASGERGLIGSEDFRRLASDNRISPAPVAATPKSPILGFLGETIRPGLQFFSQTVPHIVLLVLFFVGTSFFGIFLLVNGLERISNGSSSPKNALAEITACDKCKWASSAPSPNVQLQQGQRLHLEGGLVRITYSSGASVLLEGPAQYEIQSENAGFLSQGKLTARAGTANSHGFTVNTPRARFIDQGTEFGVKVDEKGGAAVAVFEGEVQAQARSNGGWTAPLSLGRGEALRWEGEKVTRQIAARSEFPTITVPAAPVQTDAYGQLVLSDRPKAYWRLHENAGSLLVTDASGNGYEGKAIGTVEFGQPGPAGIALGRAARFRDNGYLEVARPLVLNSREGFSVEAWAKLEGEIGVDKYGSVLASRSMANGALQGWVFYAWKKGNQEVVWHPLVGDGNPGPGWRDFITDSRAVERQWTHLAMTFRPEQGNSGIAKFYVNGQLAGSVPTSFQTNSSRPLRIGAGCTEGEPNDYFNGAIAEAAVYDRELTEQQIQRHFQVGMSAQNQ